MRISYSMVRAHKSRGHNRVNLKSQILNMVRMSSSA
jgi:hypothetical protein